jgi:hypothetical protein
MNPDQIKQSEKNWSYYHGDHWQFWVGPVVPTKDDPDGKKMAQLERVFQSANLIGECVDNWRDGLIAEPFTWYLKGSDGERVDKEKNQTAAQAEIQLQRWLDWVNQQAIASSSEQSDPWNEFVLALGVAGEAALRLWQPAKFEDDPDPIKRLHLHCCKLGTVEVDRDDDDFIESISYTYGKGRQEIQKFEQGQLVTTVEVDGKATGEPIKINTEGRWTIQQVRARSILSPSVKKLQNGINHALTMMLRNQELSGFRERVFLNAEYPQDEDGNPIEIERGPGRDLYAYSAQTGTDNQGNPQYNNIGVHESEPVDVESFEKAILIYRTFMYLAMKQGHLLSAADGKLSGESRIQMRQGFELFLRGFKRRIESAIANILNIVLKLLEVEGFEVVVELKISTGKLSSEERTALIAEHQAGALSLTSLIAKLGTVTDSDAELALINEEIAEQAKRKPSPPVTETFPKLELDDDGREPKNGKQPEPAAA